MQLDARELLAFYDSAMGAMARRMILRRLRLLWPDGRNTRVLGYGFAVPYLRSFQIEAERTVAAMPAEMGAVGWPDASRLVTLTDEDALPFPDAMFDRVLVVHGLEGADAVRPLMRQLWRVLAPEGRMLIVAPNRTSLWAQIERSPFAHGRPFHRRELERLLRGAMFEPLRWDCALYGPPLKSRAIVRSGAGWERIGRRLWPRLGGVHLVEASKSIYAPVAVARRRSVTRVAAAVPSPAN
ncbi:MAG: methyltransferase domain-containing protein [Alphaproteobacteria bacterium]|nr:methyltransferase domain-containing protein [Alphaproteobacteria bacterium]MBV9694842.1 methyltransferase domain-containing protein [Alphaproteobacteria bacterium]